VRIDVWSDVVCPFCFLGEKNLATALEGFEHADEVSVFWHSFQLDPTSEPGPAGGDIEMLKAKYGMSDEQVRANHDRLAAAGREAGIDFRFDLAHTDNTFDAHRVLQLAGEHDRGTELNDRLLTAHFTEGKLVSDHDTLADLAAEVGLDAEEVRTALASDAYADDVRADIAQAHAYGISAVPTFVIDEQYGVTGAQPPEALRQALDEVWSKSVAEV